MSRLTVRARLTALYGGMLVVSSLCLIALCLVLLGTLTPIFGAKIAIQTEEAPPPELYVRDGSFPEGFKGEVKEIGFWENPAVQLVGLSALALALFAAITVSLAWWMAGKALRPVHAITATARRLSAENLHERIALQSPPDELKLLADTFDQMLDRLESVMAAQRRFVASAAHELRTPLTVHRAALEIGLADPTDHVKVARVRDELLTVVDGNERLIEGLLLLAGSAQGLDAWEEVKLDAVVADVVAGVITETPIFTDLEPAVVSGDPILLRHLVNNLVANAVTYNRPDGRVDVRVADGVLEVVNTGPVVPDASVPLLFEPFRRLAARRHQPGEGTGLGLSIVASIVRAHFGSVTATANPGGGLRVLVRFT
ncbi:ATP-binding protein [Nonomuraea sp. NPDC050556]|uniref:ATP-binding protein n=1 Tax=Nonomuraea sp. NPDC050556 TaxID=3364369 RepID=UPI00378D494B